MKEKKVLSSKKESSSLDKYHNLLMEGGLF
jgi:hypothetical protein